MNKKNIDLITFQFNKWGGSSVVELAVCPVQGNNGLGNTYTAKKSY